MALMSSCWAYDFYVGGRDGWVQHPRDSYDSWAGRNRFQVKDRLVFKYKQGNDSVLVVSKTDYDSCNTTDPKESYTDGNSIFQFNRSGPIYFISGAAGHCTQGQKLVVVVMAIRNHTAPPSPAPSPSAPAPESTTPSSPPSVAVPPTSENVPPPAGTTPAPESSSTSTKVAISEVCVGVVMAVLMALVRA
ncbi:hypothetical protein Cni_G10783 [Canna indica]|uniref:Phytocyanin domain-containing protein n=1 Tax=Canna indica TaxID=4628 RepID=A0AAQ3K559_9LILI|nr:hypothetical protein Cni_G10783 [Canna indica]